MRRNRHRFPPGALLPVVVLSVLVAAGCSGAGDDVPIGGDSDRSDGNFPVGTGSGLNERACPLQYTEFSSPDASGADPLLAQQWHLRNTGQNAGVAGEDLRATTAWTITRGLGVRVAVIDDAIEVLHDDLAPNIVAGASFNYRPDRRGSSLPLPCTRADDHGTSVAGIIAARGNNGLGVSGVAPDASLVGYNALATGANSDVADALTRNFAGNAIYHNSWGAPDDGELHPADAAFVSAIDSGVRSGRNGKGSIYVFAAGNGGCYAFDEAGNCYRENSNYDGYVNKLGLITVCAVDNAGRQPFYGETGANFLVCGPSSNESTGITTTTIGSSYTSSFTGTSASTPMVSGVVALMLAANPALTWRDVQQVLARSARQTQPDDAGWAGLPGLPFNPKFGFGVADAGQAVALAQTWTSIGGSESLQQCGPYETAPSLPIPDPDGALIPVESPIDVTDCGIRNIEFVEVRLTATHTYSGDLDIRLISPAGLVSELAGSRVCGNSRTNPSGDACGSYDDWPFGSIRHLDEASNGQWRLRLADGQAADTGTLDKWTITFFGR